MTESENELYVLLGSAQASGDYLPEKYISGLRYPILAIAMASDHDDAVRIFHEKCDEANWHVSECRKVGKFSRSGEDTYLLNAEASARENGYGWIIYDKPIVN